MVLKATIFYFLFFISGVIYAQTSIKQIDSLILIAKQQNEVDSSSKTLKLIKQNSEELNYKSGLISYALIEAVNLYNRGEFDESLRLSYDYEKLVIKEGKPAQISHLYALRANCFTNLFFFDKSQECLLLAKSYSEKIKDKNTRYFSLGRVYRIMATNFDKNSNDRVIDSVIFYHKKSYDIQSKITQQGVNQAGVVIQAAALGDFFLEKEQIDSARYYYKESASLAQKNNLTKYAVEAHIGLGNIHLMEGKTKLALQDYLKGFPFAISSKNVGNIKALYEALAKTYEQLGDDKKSLAYYKKFANIADSIALVTKKSATVPAKYIIKEREIVQEKEKHIQNIYLAFAICVSGLSILIVFVLYRNVRASKKTNKSLNSVNKQMITQNEYLQETLEALENSNKENNKMMQIIAHDLRSPIAAVVGLSGLLLDEDKLTDDHREMVKLINSSTKDSLKFIGDILQQETSALVLKKDDVDLHQLLQYCTTQLRYRAREKNQTIVLDSNPIIVPLNREKIWRVISNLITNAIKFSPEQAKIFVALERKGDYAIISIRDTGIGIPEELKARIFDSNDDTRREGTGGEKSFGLGLGISKQIVEEHGGTLTFESNTMLGTTFLVYLPL
ncbi:MAG: HAMP domain-containing histidine kinase [Pedobacter sp.]|nr:MAG: HAMP domain-containing histidine kinase [Pedobacter sp.]